jgi:cytochrome c556
MSRRLVAAAVVALTLAGPLSLTAACSSSAKKDATNAPADTSGSSDTSSPEEVIVSDAEVSAGIAQVDDEIALALTQLPTDQAKAKATVEQVYDSWYGIEGTIKKNSKDLYLDMEDGLGAVKNGVDQNDATKAQKGSTDFSAAASKYLQQFPAVPASTTTTKAP